MKSLPWSKPLIQSESCWLPSHTSPVGVILQHTSVVIYGVICRNFKFSFSLRFSLFVLLFWFQNPSLPYCCLSSNFHFSLDKKFQSGVLLLFFFLFDQHLGLLVNYYFLAHFCYFYFFSCFMFLQVCCNIVLLKTFS